MHAIFYHPNNIHTFTYFRSYVQILAVTKCLGMLYSLTSSISNLSETLTCFAKASFATSLAFSTLDSLTNKYIKITVKNERKMKKHWQGSRITIERHVMYECHISVLDFKETLSGKYSHTNDLFLVCFPKLGSRYITVLSVTCMALKVNWIASTLDPSQTER